MKGLFGSKKKVSAAKKSPAMENALKEVRTIMADGGHTIQMEYER